MNWTITNVTTEQVASIPTRMRITKRGRVVVAIAYAVVALAIGHFMIGAMVEAEAYETEKATHIGAAYSKMITDKKAGLTR